VTEDYLYRAQPDVETPRDHTNVATLAELYPMVPMASILRCLVEAEREADLTAADDPAVEVARLAMARLNELRHRYDGNDVPPVEMT
jgi:hypothetical protein